MKSLEACGVRASDLSPSPVSSVGESVRFIRELQGYSQNELAKLSGIPRATLSAIENDRVRLGVERAKILGRALRCHPAVLVFPGWEVVRDSAA